MEISKTYKVITGGDLFLSRLINFKDDCTASYRVSENAIKKHYELNGEFKGMEKIADSSWRCVNFNNENIIVTKEESEELNLPDIEIKCVSIEEWKDKKLSINFCEYENFLFWKNVFCKNTTVFKAENGSSFLINSADGSAYNEFFDYKNNRYLTAKDCGFNFDFETNDLISEKINLGMSEDLIIKLRSKSIFNSKKFWEHIKNFNLKEIIDLSSEIISELREMSKLTFTDPFKQDELREKFYFKYEYLNHGDFKPRSILRGINYKDRVYNNSQLYCK